MKIPSGIKLAVVAEVRWPQNDPRERIEPTAGRIDHRDPGERLVTSPLIELGVEPLLLAPEEEVAAQRARFLRRLEEAIVQALAQWTRLLQRAVLASTPHAISPPHS